MPRTCAREGCDKALPAAAATQRKYCSERCQVAEWRRRKREQDADVQDVSGRDGT